MTKLFLMEKQQKYLNFWSMTLQLDKFVFSFKSGINEGFWSVTLKFYPWKDTYLIFRTKAYININVMLATKKDSNLDSSQNIGIFNAKYFFVHT